MRYFDKQHYLMQAQYIRQCIMNGEPHGLKEIIVDNFAGGGGASTGIEIATGYSVYAAINHDPEAIRMHMANHPNTKHYCESVSPTLIQYHTETADEIRGQDLTEPIMTIDGANRYGLVSAFIHKYFGGSVIGAECTKPLPTITATDHNSLCAVHIIQAQGQSIGTDIREPLNTMTGVNHMGEVMAFLVKYYGTCTGQDVTQPLDTVTSHGRFGLVEIQGALFQIVDIGLRMLQPHELYAAQGFPGDYIIDRDVNGRKISKTEQVQKCGNSVCPPIPAALVSANLPELCKAERLPICRPDRMLQETGGQLRFA